jgi:methyl coenzyme M reductase gamma subunit
VSNVHQCRELLAHIEGRGDDDPLAAVQAADALVRAADALLRDQVNMARFKGVTGAELGSALGVTRQAVYMRFPVSVDA